MSVGGWRGFRGRRKSRGMEKGGFLAKERGDKSKGIGKTVYNPTKELAFVPLMLTIFCRPRRLGEKY